MRGSVSRQLAPEDHERIGLMPAKHDGARSPQKQRILEAAAELFAKNGFEATSIAELSETVGLGRGALYHHIGSKEQLLYEISRARPVEMVAFGEALLAENVRAEDKLRRLSRRMMETLSTNLAGATVFLADSRSLTSRHRREIVKLRNRFEAIWAAILEEGVREGRFRATHPLVMKGILGLYNYSYVWLNPEGELPPDEIADLFSDFILHALRPGSASRER
jgi:AcrR family transcriptional regulator